MRHFPFPQSPRRRLEAQGDGGPHRWAVGGVRNAGARDQGRSQRERRLPERPFAAFRCPEPAGGSRCPQGRGGPGRSRRPSGGHLRCFSRRCHASLCIFALTLGSSYRYLRKRAGILHSASVGAGSSGSMLNKGWSPLCSAVTLRRQSFGRYEAGARGEGDSGRSGRPSHSIATLRAGLLAGPRRAAGARSRPVRPRGGAASPEALQRSSQSDERSSRD